MHLFEPQSWLNYPFVNVQAFLTKNDDSTISKGFLPKIQNGMVQAPEYLPEKSMSAAPPPFVMNHSVTETNAYEQHPQQKQVEELPELPG
ncbi:hypothetical protein ACE6H2_017851 [Prunus campanulata]